MHDTLAQSRVSAVGAIAARALAESGGITLPMPDFPDAPYRLAAGRMIWIGYSGALHPRAVMLDNTTDVCTVPPDLHPDALPPPWHAPSMDGCGAAPARVAAHLELLAREIRSLGAPRGLARLLIGAEPPFPVAARSAEARALAAAVRCEDPEGFEAAALRLIGVGDGLTPSGDDFVGAALFALHVLRPDHRHWTAVATRLCAQAHARSHVISATLLGDLAAGRSFAPLHELLIAAAAGGDLRSPARALTGIGHSSGWDMLAGLIAGAAAAPAPSSTH